jgi:CRP-like cAMP-binding protein
MPSPGAYRQLTSIVFGKLGKFCANMFYDRHRRSEGNEMKAYRKTLFRKQTLFSFSSDDVVSWAEDRMCLAEYAAGDDICFQGDPRSPLIFLISGQLRTSTISKHGVDVPLRVINPGQSVGEQPILLELPIHCNIAAARKCTVGLLDRGHARELLNQSCVSRALNKAMAQQILGFIDRYSAQGLPRADARISAVIESAIGNTRRGELALIELPSHAIIAAMAKVSRETVSRVLKSLELRDIIAKEGRQVRIRDRIALRNLATG